MAFEYKVVPAPTKGLKARGVKSTASRFANALETAMNELGAEGWEYQRTDTLPCEEREGLMGKTTVYQNMLVFRRAIADTVTEETPVEATKALPPPAPEPEAVEPDITQDPAPETNPDDASRLAAE